MIRGVVLRAISRMPHGFLRMPSRSIEARAQPHPAGPRPNGSGCLPPLRSTIPRRCRVVNGLGRTVWEAPQTSYPPGADCGGGSGEDGTGVVGWDGGAWERVETQGDELPHSGRRGALARKVPALRMCLTIPLFGDTVYSCCKSGDTSCSTREWSWNYL